MATVGVRWAIGLSVVPGLLAAAAIVYAVRHARAAAARERVPLRGAVAAFEVGNVAATLLILRATELPNPGHGTKLATAIAIGLYVAYNAAASVASVPAGRPCDRLGPTGPVKVLTAGVAVSALAYAGFAVTRPLSRRSRCRSCSPAWRSAASRRPSTLRSPR